MACAYNLHSLLLHITISSVQLQSHVWTHEIPVVWGCDKFSASHSQVINFKGPPPPNCCLHSNSQMLCSAHQRYSTCTPHPRAEKRGICYRFTLRLLKITEGRHKDSGKRQRNQQPQTHAYSVYILLCAV